MLSSVVIGGCRLFSARRILPPLHRIDGKMVSQIAGLLLSSAQFDSRLERSSAFVL
jgi:hypothetical protein